ncbi:facilitated trehalose transporter Tret1 [Fopius arisanus]|uniref:Facilitated trehalose transporter Tret1 n=1 Tax=Fopius arisanus TaxID=64838 RepID=A0A0C9RG22_9HYME|nr:PREDICTED: facilitated trehalose transporter Tret1-like [Fopius arisanus]
MLNQFKFWWKTFKSTDARGVTASLAAHSGQISLGLSQGFSAVLIPKLLESNLTSIIEASWIASLGVISNPLGSLIAGSTAECFGRRAAIALATLPHAAGWLFIALSTNISMLYIGRFISGIGAGMANALYLYVTEVAAPGQRSWLASCGPVLVSVGVLCSYALGALTTWQCTAAISIAPAILSLALTRLIPESPAWLARKGRLPEAQESLLWLRGPGIACDTEYRELVGVASLERHKDDINLSSAILRPNIWKPFVILFVFFALQQMSGIYIILFYTVNVLKDIGADIDEYVASVGIGVVRLLAAILGAICAGHFDRRTLACTSAIGMAISALLVAVSKRIIQAGIIPEWIPIVCVASHVGFSMIGYLTLPWVMTSELYPLRFRGVMGGLTTGIAQIMTFTAVKTYPEISNIVGIQFVMLAFGVASIFGAVFSLAILPETRGRSLEEIERRFSLNFKYSRANDVKIFLVSKFSGCQVENPIGRDNPAFQHDTKSDDSCV